MYKVFIDHKPVQLVKEKEMTDSLPFFYSDEVKDISTVFDQIDEEISLDYPLQIVCDNVDVEFERLFSSHKLIEAAGGVVQSENGYLLIKRHGLWDIPKGKVEMNESPAEAAIREIEEECGIEAPIIEQELCITFHTYSYKGRNVLKKTYWYVLFYKGVGNLEGQLEEGITDVKWMSLNEMMGIRGKTFGSINEVLDSYRHLLL